jgi:ADP-ribose pyrophosphatase
MPRQLIYHGQKVDLYTEPLPLPGGGTLTKEIVSHPGAAVILPWVDADRICMVQNYRVPIQQTLLELPAGTLDRGEPPEVAAVRELEEETGYRPGRCRKIAQFYPSPGILTELMHLFVAEDLHTGRQQLEPGEQLKPVLIPWTDALRMALDGTIQDAKTLIGLLLWDRLRGR